jgi:formylglycine-generating enzyme required for sulfatase activity
MKRAARNNSRWVWGVLIGLLLVSLLAVTLPGLLNRSAAATSTPAKAVNAPTKPKTTVTQPPIPTINPNTPLPPACTQMGQTWLSSVDGMTLVCVPGGEFLMGATDADKNAEADEKPQHSVFLDSYWIDRTLVTNAQFALCVAAGTCREPANKSSYSRGDYYGNAAYANYPALYANWNQAATYCAWAGRKLPTEAQWEKAARGTDGRIFPWGSQPPSDKLVNSASNVGDTTPVGQYSPQGDSPYGVQDMAGNIWEWTADWFGPYSSGAQRNPTGAVAGTSRVLRGGAWGSDVHYIRATDRFTFVPDNLGYFRGFRCVQGAAAP